MRLHLRSAALAALVFSALILGLVIPASAAGGGLALEADTSLLAQGQTVTVSVGVTNNPGIAYARFDVSYDTEILTLTSVRNTGLLPGMFTTSKTLDTEPFVLSFASASDMTASGSAALLTFTVRDGAPVGETAVSVRCPDANNQNLQKLSLSPVSLSLRIICAEHTGGKATCSERAVCTVCGQPYGELGNHRYGSWTKEISATCTEPGVHGYYCCSVCGRLFNGTKKEITSLVIEPLGHKFGKYVSDGNADCTHDGTETATCQRCGVTDTRMKKGSALGHDFAGAYFAEAAGHYRLCSRCGAKSATAAHTAGKDGVCTVCGYVVSVPVGHTHTLTFVPEVPATCTRAGTSAYYRCTGCGLTFADAAGKTETSVGTIPALGHDFAGTYFAEAAGHYRLCSRCGAGSGMLPHVMADGVCSVCGYEAAHEHCFTDHWAANRFAHWLECEGCGERIVVTAHTPGPAATATEPQVCIVCGYVLAPATGDDPDLPPDEPADGRTDTLLWVVALVMGFGALTEGAVLVALALKRR